MKLNARVSAFTIQCIPWQGEELAEKLQELKTDHAGLSMNLNGVKKKIRESKNMSST